MKNKDLWGKDSLILVLVRVTIAEMKHYDQSNYISISLFILKGSQDRVSSRAEAWRQELMQRPWRDTSYSLASCGLLSLRSYRTQNHTLRGNTTRNGCALPHQPRIKNMLFMLAYSPTLWKHFLNWESLFSDESSLCEVDIKPLNTTFQSNKDKMREII